ncbi:TPA_asm: protein 4 [Guizotia virus 1]|uniref:Protein 4 n=1 Tax=Guizotia virus 1 TaxID=2977969 RepID=A0A9N6YJ27_9RHAB|nr:TPA_asm: protein 4 [Guizotia virus 1]
MDNYDKCYTVITYLETVFSNLKVSYASTLSLKGINPEALQWSLKLAITLFDLDKFPDNINDADVINCLWDHFIEFKQKVVAGMIFYKICAYQNDEPVVSVEMQVSIEFYTSHLSNKAITYPISPSSSPHLIEVRQKLASVLFFLMPDNKLNRILPRYADLGAVRSRCPDKIIELLKGSEKSICLTDESSYIMDGLMKSGTRDGQYVLPNRSFEFEEIKIGPFMFDKILWINNLLCLKLSKYLEVPFETMEGLINVTFGGNNTLGSVLSYDSILSRYLEKGARLAELVEFLQHYLEVLELCISFSIFE